MYFSMMFVGILMLCSIIILPQFVYAYDGKSSPPLTQLNNGTATQNIVCSNDLELIYKSTNDYPACVTQQTAENLIKHGWGVFQPVNYLINVSGILVHYNFTGGNMQVAKLDTINERLILSVKMISDGMLNITIPRTLIAGTCNERCDLSLRGTDVPFFALGDGKEPNANLEDSVTTPVDRTLFIHIQNGTKEIEIFANEPI